MRLIAAMAGFAALAMLAPSDAHAQDREPPYWASISAGRANMRTGPGRNFPISWLYRRADLPVRVVEIYNNWRKIEDPDGIRGWMLVNLLSAERTAMVAGDVRPMRQEPEPQSRVRYRAEPGVVGKISNCRSGWCEFDVGGRTGWIETRHLFGVGESERVD